MKRKIVYGACLLLACASICCTFAGCDGDSTTGGGNDYDYNDYDYYDKYGNGYNDEDVDWHNDGNGKKGWDEAVNDWNREHGIW